MKHATHFELSNNAQLSYYFVFTKRTLPKSKQEMVEGKLVVEEKHTKVDYDLGIAWTAELFGPAIDRDKMLSWLPTFTSCMGPEENKKQKSIILYKVWVADLSTFT